MSAGLVFDVDIEIRLAPDGPSKPAAQRVEARGVVATSAAAALVAVAARMDSHAEQFSFVRVQPADLACYLCGARCYATCDGPPPAGRLQVSCDRPICRAHVFEPHPMSEKHYCPEHRPAC